MMLSTVSSKPPAALAALALAGAGAPASRAVAPRSASAASADEARTEMCMEKYTIEVNRTSLPTVYSSEPRPVHFFFDGALSNASARLDLRPNCHNRRRCGHHFGVRSRAVRSRFRAERAIHPEPGREGRGRQPDRRPGRGGASDFDGRGGQARDGAEPRHQDPAFRPGDSGYRRLFRPIILGADV